MKKEKDNWTKRCYYRHRQWYFSCLKRDNYRCVDCDSTSLKDKILIVHHIDEGRKAGILNNDLINLATLCRPCHAKRHGLTSDIHDIFEMRESGMTFREIGDKIGVSRQRVHQLYKKTGT